MARKLEQASKGDTTHARVIEAQGNAVCAYLIAALVHLAKSSSHHPLTASTHRSRSSHAVAVGSYPSGQSSIPFVAPRRHLPYAL